MSVPGAILIPLETFDSGAPKPKQPLVRPGDVVSVLGLGASGVAAARLAKGHGAEVYASDVAAGELQEAAAAELGAERIEAEIGRHDLGRICASDLVVVSPGIPPSAEVRRELRDAGTPCVAEVELAYRDLTSRVIGITGTNGKTTTTALCEQILQTGGLSALAGGNIGTPLSEIAMREEQPDWVVVELSSFQLADTDAFASDIGLLLNLAPDHLDRYRDVSTYFADKKRLFRNASAGSRWVLNADDAHVMELARGAAGTSYLTSTSGPVERGAYLGEDGSLRLVLPGRDETWLAADELRIIGGHNVANALAAGLVAALAGCEGASVATIEDVLWVNDSKATNVAATLVAVQAFERPIVLILGGRPKGEPFLPLIPWLQHSGGVVAFGEAAPQVVGDLNGSVPAVQVEGNLESAVRAASMLARPGDVVLFSPACSSFDMFRNYKERGRAYQRAVEALEREAGTE
jgi:UDP-N-acetylmuramoylalanine--D-glutamate ligase